MLINAEASREMISLAAEQLSKTALGFHQQGWCLGTGGNFSAVVKQDPLRVLITASGVDKGQLDPSQFVLLDSAKVALEGSGRPSAETDLHYAIINAVQAGAVLHTHSVPCTVLSERHLEKGELRIKGLEMLKGLDGVKTHEHEEVFPILENSQDMPATARKVEELFKKYPKMHGFLLAGHGLTTWGKSIAEAKRHVEIIEFLLEVQMQRESNL